MSQLLLDTHTDRQKKIGRRRQSKGKPLIKLLSSSYLCFPLKKKFIAVAIITHTMLWQLCFTVSRQITQYEVKWNESYREKLTKIFSSFTKQCSSMKCTLKQQRIWLVSWHMGHLLSMFQLSTFLFFFIWGHNSKISYCFIREFTPWFHKTADILYWNLYRLSHMIQNRQPC